MTIRASKKNRQDYYRTEKCDGFDSKKERDRYRDLELLAKIGEISDLKTQVPLVITPRTVIGKKVYRPLVYIADFAYRDKQGNQVYEDAKGFKTEKYRIKVKLLAVLHGIQVKEV